MNCGKLIIIVAASYSRLEMHWLVLRDGDKWFGTCVMYVSSIIFSFSYNIFVQAIFLIKFLKFIVITISFSYLFRTCADNGKSSDLFTVILQCRTTSDEEVIEEQILQGHYGYPFFKYIRKVSCLYFVVVWFGSSLVYILANWSLV